jgi:hypothetical protein
LASLPYNQGVIAMLQMYFVEEFEFKYFQSQIELH